MDPGDKHRDDRCTCGIGSILNRKTQLANSGIGHAQTQKGRAPGSARPFALCDPSAARSQAQAAAETALVETDAIVFRICEAILGVALRVGSAVFQVALVAVVDEAQLASLRIGLIFSRQHRSLSMAKGTVKWFNPTKGYGFIQPAGGGGKDVFVHISAVEKAGLSTLNEGQTVEYEEVPNKGKTSAENLKVCNRRTPSKHDTYTIVGFAGARWISRMSPWCTVAVLPLSQAIVTASQLDFGDTAAVSGIASPINAVTPLEVFRFGGSHRHLFILSFIVR